MLDKQVKIFSVDTGNFYSNRELRLHKKNHKLRTERNELVEKLSVTKNSIVKLSGLSEDMLKSFLNDDFDIDSLNLPQELIEKVLLLRLEYKLIQSRISHKKERIDKSKEKLLKILANKVDINIKTNGKHHTRILRENDVSKLKEISVFESFLTRTIQAETNEFTDGFMVVQVYYFDIFKDLLFNGFEYNNEKYIYFTSSAGQIRTKKCVFMKESLWNKYMKTFMCGVTIDDINARGGNNPNKHIAYLALCSSATDLWKEFDIDKCIVIDDFEGNVYGTYDLIDETDFSITRKTGDVPVPHTDGCGMILPNAFGVEQINMMIRLPWIKGLISPFDFRKFIEVNNCSPVIKDIYGKEHDVIKEDIQVILTKSQLKAYKYYDSFEQYQEYFKKYNCTAGFTNPEEERFKNSCLNYQMLQTLTDITDDEIKKIAWGSQKFLLNICSSVEDLEDFFGITPYNTDMTYLQKSIQIYPDLMNDKFIKDKVREMKDSYVKRFKAGKLKIEGKYTFVLPDLYAACEHWFMGVENPKGLFDSGDEIFCWLFRKNEKVDCLRSPHLDCAHAIRKNVAYDLDRRDKFREWFNTNAIYTGTKDLISKVLQLDVDGDHLLVVSDKNIINIAERNLKKFDIVPLYYNMRKAESKPLTNENIYNGIVAAFTGGNIGIISNNVSKIWNDDVFSNGSFEEKCEAINCVKRLCCYNNFVIDFAKTLYKPEFPKEISKQIKYFTNNKLPHFFIYAKDKEKTQVENKTQSFVNKLDTLIKSPRLDFKKLGLGSIDYKLLMNNPDIECKCNINSNDNVLKTGTNPLIIDYLALNKKYHFQLDNELYNRFSFEKVNHHQDIENVCYRDVIKEAKDTFNQYGYSEQEITDILVKFLYNEKPTTRKTLLWCCYGENIYNNLLKTRKNNLKTIQCVDCGEWIFALKKDTKKCRCESCQLEQTRLKTKLRVQKFNNSHKLTIPN